MNTLFNLIVIVQVLSALAIIGLVLLQHGKGADMGAAFGSGASGSLFGATGSSNFMSKSTAIAAVVFFSATLALSYVTTHQGGGSVSGGVMEKAVPAAPAPTTGAGAIPATTAPAAPAAGAPASSAPEAAPAGAAGAIPK
jgi:preprotein translocase subunit SecG